MRPSQFIAAREALEQAVRDADDLLTQLRDNTRIEQAQQDFLKAFGAGARGDGLPDLEHVHQAWGHRWATSAGQAAVWLRRLNLENEAVGIEAEIAKLPDRPPRDWDTLCEQNRIAGEAASRVKEIVTSTLRWLIETLASSKRPAAAPREAGHKKINARMLETLQANPDALGWTARMWAGHLRCAKSTVVETQAWRNLRTLREQQRAEKALDRRRRLKGSERNKGRGGDG